MKVKPLTPRETEVLKLIALNLPNKAIAFDLSISEKTVQKHRQSVMDKLEIHNVVDLVHFALASGLVENKYKFLYLANSI